MTLQMTLENLDGLDESVSKLYLEKDGVFVLDVAGHAKNDAQDKSRVPLSRLKQEVEKRKDAEKSLSEIVEDLKKDVPEDMLSLVPELSPGKLIVWLRNASAKGLFDPPSKESIDSKRPGDQKPKDLDGLSPQQKIAQGYKKK